MGATRSPSLWNNLLALFPNSTALQVLNPETGELNWQLGPPLPPPDPTTKLGEDEDPSSLMYATQRILARPLRSGSSLLCLRGDGAVISVTVDHLARRLAKLETPLRDDLYSARPVIVGAKLWACSRRGYLCETSLENGQVLSSQTLSGPSRLLVTADLLGFADRILITSEDGTLFSIKAGAPKESWRLSWTASSVFSRDGEMLFAPLRAGNDQCLVTTAHDLHCVGADKGELRWRLRVPQGISQRPYCLSLNTSDGQAPPPRKIYVTTDDAHLLEISAVDGALLRTWNLPGPASSEPIADEEDVFVAFKDGTVRCYPLKP